MITMFLNSLSAATGIPEAVLRLLLSIILSYPVALFYRFTLLRPLKTKWAPFIRNLYVVITGLGLSYLYNRSDIKHSLTTTVLTWFLCYFGDIIGNRRISAIASFVFNLSYLVWGYYVTATDDYDVNWTMTQCVLCLRMIGFSLDFMDGAKFLKSKPPVSSNVEKDTNDSTRPLSEQAKVETTSIVRPPKQPISFEKNIQLPQLPSLLETIGYAHFFGAFLTGPQFSFQLYRKFLTASLYPDINNVPPGSYRFALKSFVLGALYLGAHQIGAGYFPTSYLITQEYAAKPFAERLVAMWWAGKFSFTKYLGIWTLVEGACILSGISFNGYDDNGNVEWNGLANVDKWKFEFATSLAQIIGSFNTNTNLWTKTYIFKRLIFLGNKNLSSIISLVFLALWHGLHSGYYMCFGLEFVDMEVEKRWTKRLENYTKPLYHPQNKHNSSIKYVRYLHQLVCWFGQTCALHYAMISFDLLKLEHWISVYNSVYWIGHIAVFSFLFLDSLLPKPKTKLMKINGTTKVNGNLIESKKEQ